MEARKQMSDLFGSCLECLAYIFDTNFNCYIILTLFSIMFTNL